MSNLKRQITELLENVNPKQYSSRLKTNADLYQQVINYTDQFEPKSISERIYIILNGNPQLAPCGKKPNFRKFGIGYAKFCQTNCDCANISRAKQVSHTKQQLTSHEKETINNKRITTMQQKYGVNYNSQRDDIKHLWSKPKISDSAYTKLTDYEWLNNEYNTKQRSLVDIANELQVYYGTVAEYCKSFNFTIRQNSNYSQQEVEINTFINSLNIVTDRNNWNILHNKEIDIVIPDYNIGIEINGLYWHSYTNEAEDVNRHLNKKLEAQQKGIDLIHITDYEWIYKNDIIKNLIRSKLGLNQTVFARKCNVINISKQIEKEFLNQYHLQGYVGSQYAFGLMHNNELLMIVTVGHSRFDKDINFEILRVCSKSGITVTGGLSKLISHIKKILSNSTFVTYCDFDKSNGNAYHKANMDLVSRSNPGYFWTDGNAPISRYKCQKNQLSKWLTTYDSNMSGSQNMFNAGYRRYWNCGNLKFTFDSQ